MNKVFNYLIVSIIFNLSVNFPIFFYKTLLVKINHVHLISELVLTFIINNIIFHLIIFNRRVNICFSIFLFICGGIANYFLLTHRKILDAGVFIDFLSVESDLTMEYFNPELLVFIIVFGILGYFLSVKKSHNELLFSAKFVLINIFCFLLLSAYASNFLSLNRSLSGYFPYNIIHGIYYLTYKYLPHLKAAKNKVNLAKTYNLDFKPAISREPLKVVLIIGESMRGDMLSLNGYPADNMPRLSKVQGLASFNNATSSSTSTRISIPYMLTRACPPNFKQAMSEQSIISLFKSMGFSTSWIGNQGAFGSYETTYASIAMEADYVLLQPQIKKLYGTNKTYDEYLIQFIKNRISEVNNNHFIVIHLYGSHWRFDERYPASFVESFRPSCKAPTPSHCSQKELTNAYHNTISYTDYVIAEILKLLDSENAFVIYASDHGWSLGENNIFGNGNLDEPMPKEQLNIAIFSWGSRSFLKSHNNRFTNLSSKKFDHISHDYIFHSLLGCIGVKSEIIDQNLNLCRP